MMSARSYPARPLVGVATVLLRGDTVLMIRRARAPRAGLLSFPGGAQRLGEAAEDAARRELMEETGMRAGTLRLIAHADVIDRDEAGDIRFHYTVLDFAGEAGLGEPRAGGDVSEAGFVAIGSLEALGVDAAHRDVVMAARLEVR